MIWKSHPTPWHNTPSAHAATGVTSLAGASDIVVGPARVPAERRATRRWRVFRRPAAGGRSRPDPRKRLVAGISAPQNL
ncbi:hypothetical protein FRACA_150011 [Frankia canadensis]|uniref:Uncharacterized protein n=1 Tax=Frankia canadensis TaxID=1836972 RepID=A0A2I2KLV4_9ACTN|nr:hypothetical protein FRACA_150011 [Frankia canadensis]SOU53929.1 hypothetical protein FRACA_150011 [Frankia canadensis]